MSLNPNLEDFPDVHIPKASPPRLLVPESTHTDSSLVLQEGQHDRYTQAKQEGQHDYYAQAKQEGQHDHDAQESLSADQLSLAMPSLSHADPSLLQLSSTMSSPFVQADSHQQETQYLSCDFGFTAVASPARKPLVSPKQELQTDKPGELQVDEPVVDCLKQEHVDQFPPSSASGRAEQPQSEWRYPSCVTSVDKCIPVPHPLFKQVEDTAVATHKVAQEPTCSPGCEQKVTNPLSSHASGSETRQHVQLEQHYPAPLATHDSVLADKRLFWETLSRLQEALSLKFEVPKIGENDVDLHRLYKEVTHRGGLEAVIKDRKWREVALAFNFPPTVTSASCILRRSYINCLHHYEQIYFFGYQGKILAPPAAYAVQSPSLSHLADASASQESMGEIDTASMKSKGITDSAEALGVDPASSIGMTVAGAIDGKFDNGYLVSVMVGARKMRGVLYHVSATNSTPQHACVPALMRSVGSDLRSSDLVQTGSRKRRRTEFLKKDPNAPRQNRTGYNFFFAEQRAKLKSVQTDKDRAISKMIGDLWNKLSEDEKSPYQAQGLKDKERYRREMREYKEKFKLPPICEEASKTSKSVLQVGNVNMQNSDTFAKEERSRASIIEEDTKKQMLVQSLSANSNHAEREG